MKIFPLYPFRVAFLILLGFVCYPIFAVLIFQRRRAEKKDSPRILIIPQLTRIGDLICATPVFKQIKEKYQNCHLTVLVTPKIAGIVKNNPRLDEIILLEDRDYLEFFGLFRLFKRVRERHFDWSINLASSTMGSLIALYGGIPHRIKIVKPNPPLTESLIDWWNQHRILYRFGERIPLLYLRSLTPLGIESSVEGKKEIFTSAAGDSKTQEFFSKYSITANDFIIGISVSAGNRIKEWGDEKFASLARQLVAKYGAQIIFIGPPSDSDRIDKIVQAAGWGFIKATNFSLEGLPSLIKRFNLFIAVDSGPIHIAHALGVPLIDIIGPVDPDEQAPNYGNYLIVKSPSDIKPTIFALRSPGDPIESRKAVGSITVKQVFEAVEDILRL